MKGLGRNTIDDFRYGVPERAFGSEVEYTHRREIVQPFKDRYLDAPESQLIFYVSPEYAVAPGRNHHDSVITRNGGELYLDLTSLEFATPECRTPSELVTHERAGEVIVADVVDRLSNHFGTKEKVFKRTGYVDTVVADKRFSQDSIGYHESYTSMNEFTTHSASTAYGKETKKLKEAQCLCDFLALRKLIDGAGMVANNHFSLSQKSRAINFNYYRKEGVRGGTKEPFYIKSSRLEVRAGENSKSDWATEFTFGVTSLVLRLLEHQRYPEHLMLRDANDAARRVARTPNAAVALQSGITMRAIDVLKEIVEEAYALASAYPDMPEYEEKAFQDFQKFYADMHRISLRDHDVKALADRINWAARFDFLVKAGATYDTFTASDLNQISHDLVWDRIGEKDIARRRLSKLGLTALTADVLGPPQTRAATRIKIAGNLYKEDNLRSVEWFKVTPKTGEPRLLGGPLNTQATWPDGSLVD